MIIIIIILSYILIKTQIKYCNSENKWQGLVVPLTLFILSIIYVTLTTTTTVTLSESISYQNVNNTIINNVSFGSNIYLQMLKNIILLNIPTLVLLIIYIYKRKLAKK